MQTAQTKRRLLFELLAVAAMLCCVLIPFQRSIFQGASISKMDMLKPMDAVQAPTLYAPWCILDDLSSSMAHVPNELFARNQAAEAPLWNQLNGAGRPFAGEFQTLQFSFFHSLFPATNAYAYNLGIIFKILLSASGTFALARCLKLSLFSAMTTGM
jgi:hypothetical protein